MDNIQAAFDQIEAMLRDMAPVLFTYYKNLIKAGFDKEQALQLTRDYQRIMLTIGGDS